MFSLSTLTRGACGVALAALASQASGMGADGRACRHAYFIDPQLSAGLAGTYELSNGEQLRISGQMRRFYADMPGIGRIEIVPVDADVFVERNGPVQMAFAREAFSTKVVVTGLDGQESGPPLCRG